MLLHILSMGISWTIGLSATEAYLRNAFAGSSYVFSLLIQEFEKAKTKHLMLGFLFLLKARRAPIFAFEFEKALFAFEAERPHSEPSRAEPPTCRSLFCLPDFLRAIAAFGGGQASYVRLATNSAPVIVLGSP